MKIIKEKNISIRLNNFPDDLEELINESLDSKDFSRKLSARETLVKMGKKILPQMHKLLNSENDSLCLEAAKIVDKHEDAVTVLSTHETSGFEEKFIGGNAYKITSHSRNPVITVRRSKIPSNIDNIVLPLDPTFQTREKVLHNTSIPLLIVPTKKNDLLRLWH